MFHKNNPSQQTVEDPIKHVIFLMLENHSFDQMLGCFQQKYPHMEGINQKEKRFNCDDKGNKVFQNEMTIPQIPLDPQHDIKDVLEQIKENNSGYIQNFIKRYPKSELSDRENVMGYYPMGYLPALHTLANEFTICDHWFASLPGPTWPNRFFALSGSSSGRVNMPTTCNPNLPMFFQNQKNIFDRLDEAHKTWRNYFFDFPISLLLTHQRDLSHLINYHHIPHFFKDAAGSEKDFPNFVFIEPKYLGWGQNDDHPPHHTMKAEQLIADIYNAIRANEKLWESSLLIITYDEHGGFYDHVQPPEAIPPDEHKEEYTFDKLGPRVPALLISPWVKQGVDQTVFDHTSLLKYLIEKWQLHSLGERTSSANSISVALNLNESPRQDCVKYINLTSNQFAMPNMQLEKWDKNPNHTAIHLFADYLKQTKNIQTISNKPRMSSNAILKEKIGRELIKMGMWMEKEAYLQKEKRIDHTNEIANVLVGLKEGEVKKQREIQKEITKVIEPTLKYSYAG